jgi:nucleotide-binding universal stress UspA family protein
MADTVHVLHWDSPEDDEKDDGSRIQAYLRRHGVEARYRSESSVAGSVGDSLLDLACDLSADLLVMGCYGHTRAREFVLGGVSRTLLRSMTLPVLMSH